METYRLVAHPVAQPKDVKGVIVDVRVDEEEVLLTFKVEGAEHVRLPEWVTPARRDELWKTSCFELFLKPVGQNAYFEFNLSPSTEWAAYRFDGYREGITDLTVPVAPHVNRGIAPDDYVIEADIDLSAIPAGPVLMGLCAVIEELDGTKSYWALRHPPGDKPDFHHPDCFAIELPAPSDP